MKSNAPKKIYMPNELLSEEWTRHIEGEDIEYTRTDVLNDAFIEKAIKWLKEHADDYDYTWYNEMIGESGITDKMIEDFRNYMKGE